VRPSASSTPKKNCGGAGVGRWGYPVRVDVAMIRIEHLGIEDADRLRAIRTRALREAPDAFGATLEEALMRPLEGWARQVVELPTFVAVREGIDVGMVRCARDTKRRDIAFLISMWVAPDMRRRGVGGALVDAAVSWARANCVTRLLLDVVDDNAAAVALYESKGFEPNGVVGTMPPPRSHIREHQLELRL
jgi:GNAT superfamily N-acetyltransferase